MFEDFSRDEIRDLLELMYVVSYSDKEISDEEISILSYIASILNVDIADWQPNMFNLDFTYKRLKNLSFDKVKKIIAFIIQLSMFDGTVSESELKILIPIAAEHDISCNKVISIINDNLDDKALTDFDKIMVYALASKAIRADGKITHDEEVYLSDLRDELNIKRDYYDTKLIENIDWVIRMVKTYPKEKAKMILKIIIEVLVSDQELHEKEKEFLFEIATKVNLKEDVVDLFREVVGG